MKVLDSVALETCSRLMKKLGENRDKVGRQVFESFQTRARQFPGYLRSSGILATLAYYMRNASKNGNYRKLVAIIRGRSDDRDRIRGSEAGYAVWLYGFFEFLSSLEVIRLFPWMARYRMFCTVPCNEQELLKVLHELAEMPPPDIKVVRRLAEIYGEAAKTVAEIYV